jgi:hypothetical protein
LAFYKQWNVFSCVSYSISGFAFYFF